jgi:replicative DNA helicase
MSSNRDRALPYDLSAEAAILSAMMIDPLSVMKSINEVKEEYFFKPEHRVTFEAVKHLFQVQMEVDVITLIDRLESTGQLEKAGGKDYILELADIVVSGANFSYHAKILTDKYLLRELIMTSNKIVEKCYEGGVASEDLLDFAEQSIYRLSDSTDKKGFVKANQYTSEVLKTISDRATSKFGVHGVASGFIDIDNKIGGFRPGQLIILAARPSMGKSAFALNIASYAAQMEKIKVGIFTMEMSAEEILLRMISSSSGVPMDYMLKGYGMNQKRIQRVTEIADVINSMDIYIDDSGTNTPMELRAKTRRLKTELGDLGLIIIDYMQLMSSSKRNSENRQQEISEISRNLKILAKELGVPVIALSQLNRALENRDDKKPRLSDLRESGAIEQDADIVMFIYREAHYKLTEENQNDAIVIISKNRHGSTGEVNLRFVPEYTSFDNAVAKPKGEDNKGKNKF